MDLFDSVYCILQAVYLDQQTSGKHWTLPTDVVFMWNLVAGGIIGVSLMCHSEDLL